MSNTNSKHSHCSSRFDNYKMCGIDFSQFTIDQLIDIQKSVNKLVSKRKPISDISYIHIFSSRDKGKLEYTFSRKENNEWYCNLEYNNGIHISLSSSGTGSTKKIAKNIAASAMKKIFEDVYKDWRDDEYMIEKWKYGIDRTKNKKLDSIIETMDTDDESDIDIQFENKVERQDNWCNDNCKCENENEGDSSSDPCWFPEWKSMSENEKLLYLDYELDRYNESRKNIPPKLSIDIPTTLDINFKDDEDCDWKIVSQNEL